MRELSIKIMRGSTKVNLESQICSIYICAEIKNCIKVEEFRVIVYILCIYG